MSYSFSELSHLYNENKFFELTSSPEGLYFLKLRSLGRNKYYLRLYEKAKIPTTDSKQKENELLETLFNHQINSEIIDDVINEIYIEERQKYQAKEEDLLTELYKLQSFDWGGIHQNDINKYLVDNYIKKITNYDILIDKINGEILNSVRNFVLNSWYNTWTSLIIENIFKDHQRVLPTVGNIKQVDFFIDDIPFDLKVTYFPKHFIIAKRVEMGITKEGTELSDLKKAAKKYGIPLGKNLNNDDQLLNLKSAFDVSTNQEIKEFYNKFSNLIPCLINECIQQPRDLLRSLYKEQGSQRFDASNRLYLILIDTNSLEDSWKIKSDCILLKTSIDNYLDQRIFNKDELLLTWSVKNNEYQSYADVLFVLK